MNVETDYGMRFNYVLFEVQRKNNLIVSFTEAHLLRMNPLDLIYLYDDLRSWTNKPSDIQDALEVVSRAMKYKCHHDMVFDFQLALEAEQEHVNLKRPLTYLTSIEQYPPFTVLIQRIDGQDLLGVTYQDEERKKKIMWMKELEKFSDGTL